MSTQIAAVETAAPRSDRSLSRYRVLWTNGCIAFFVWALWLIFGGRNAVYHLVSDWKVALTMVLGSMVGGGTTQGGGAIAFPVFTKLLNIGAFDARNFSLAIQSVGMGAATLSILILRVHIEKRAVFYAGLPGITGVVFGAICVAPLVPSVIVRTSFTVLVTSLGAALLLINSERQAGRNIRLAWFGGRERTILIFAGFAGGIVTALVGTGENTLAFMVMVLLFRINEKIVTPTTVVLMTMVTIPGFLVHLFWLRDFSPAVMGYWLAAIPVVAVGAPLGAFICTRMSRRSIVHVLLFLISLELVSTLLLVSISRSVLVVSAVTLLVCGCLDWFMSRVTFYAPLPHSLESRD
jgi:uncharacterized protein